MSTKPRPRIRAIAAAADEAAKLIVLALMVPFLIAALMGLAELLK